MSDTFFQQALHRFLQDFNYAGAIGHLTNRGFTMGQIREQIGGHLSDDYIRDLMLKSYQEEGRLLLKEPGSHRRERVTMVKETGPYGRISYRQMREILEEEGPSLTEYIYSGNEREIRDFLDTKAQGERCYFSLSLDVRQLEKFSEILSRGQIEYLRSFLGIKGPFYLQMNFQTMDILRALCENRCYEGTCYFLKTCEKWIIYLMK